jgi:hypothetical protein
MPRTYLKDQSCLTDIRQLLESMVMFHHDAFKDPLYAPIFASRRVITTILVHLA